VVSAISMTFYNLHPCSYNAVIYLIVHIGVDMVRTIDLPRPRFLSNLFVKEEPDPVKTMAMAYWTMFIGHDLSHTAMSNMSRIKYITVYNIYIYILIGRN